VRSVEGQGTVYPWDDPLNQCSARMKQCAEWCMHQFDSLCEHKIYYEREVFDLTDQKSFFPRSLMLKEQVPAFDVPAEQPRVLLFGNTWKRVNKPGPAQESMDEEMTPVTTDPRLGNKETPTTNDMDVDKLGETNESAHICTQSQSSPIIPGKRKRGGIDGGSQDESTDSG